MATRSKASEQPRTIAVDNIVGLAEIAERTGATAHAVWNWTKRYEDNHPFPKPITTVSGRPVYDWDEVKTWNETWERSKGGYHTHKTRKETTTASRKQFMEGDDDGTKPAKSRAKKSTAKPAAKRPAAKKPAAEAGGATVTPIRRARRARRSAS